MADIAAGTVITATSDSGKTVSFKKSGGTAAGTKTAIEAAIKGAFAPQYGDPELVTELAIALHGGTPKKKVTITVSEAEAKLKAIIDTLKTRAAPVKKTEGAAAAAASAPVKKTWTGDVQKRIAEAAKSEGLKYNVSIVSKAVKESNSENAAYGAAMNGLRAAAPVKAAAAAEKTAAAEAEKAAKAAAREAERKAKSNAAAAALIAKRLGGPAGTAGRNEAWEAEVEEDFERCVAACEATKAEKLAKGRAAYARTRKTKTAGPAEAAANNSGEDLTPEAAWAMFTADLPADIVAFVSTASQKPKLEASPHYKAWKGVYAASTSKGKAELTKYQTSIKKAVGKKLEEAKAAIAAAGASRKRRGGSRKTRKTRKSRRRN